MDRRKKLFAAVALAGPSGPTRVQSSGKVSASSSASVAINLATPPTIGNTIVVASVVYNNNGSNFACSDNRGNIYNQVIKAVAASSYWILVYSCPVVTTGSPFTVTISSPTNPGNHHACAIELSGNLTVDKTITATGNSATPNTGTTAALIGTDVFALALHAIQANTPGGITVQSVTPVWTEEVENLLNTTVAGEIDTRALTGVNGTSQSCQWTDAVAGNWIAGLAVFKVISTYQARIIADGALAYWPLDDAVGSPTARELKGALTGTVVGGVTFGVTGRSGNAADFNGTTGYITAGVTPAINMAGSSYEAWINLRSMPDFNYATVVGRDNAGSTGFIYASLVRLGTPGGNPNISTQLTNANGTTQLAYNTWYHFVLTHNGGTSALFYLNGVLDSTLSAGINADSSASVYIGLTKGVTRLWNGLMQDVAIYSKVLTPAEISSHYALR